MKKGTLILLLFFVGLASKAQLTGKTHSHRFEMRSTLYGLGSSNTYDTYLSPLEYKGVEARVMHERMRFTSYGKGKISIQTILQGYISTTENKANNNSMLSGRFSWRYAMHRQFKVAPNFKLLAGGMMDANVGFMYNMRNSNNPASIYTYINAGFSGMAIYHGRFLKKNIVLRYQIDVPLIGARFSPEYMQSYYEIYNLGTSTSNWYFTSLHNQPSSRHMLSIDFTPWKGVVMRFAYVADIQQSKLKQLRTHAYSNILMFGVVKNIFKIKTKKLKSLPVY